ncbi:MAG: phosphoribosylformylglycinamidine synthase subunit PurQ [Isosphaeraceae bacterium]
MPQPKALVIRAPRDQLRGKAARTRNSPGASAEIRHIGRLLEDPDGLLDFPILTIPGGFSYGDDLGTGRIVARRRAPSPPRPGGLTLGICNGFQVLVKAGLLPGGPIPATLTRNDTGHYEARWVRLACTPGLSPFVTDDEPIELPSAHGEGKFLTADGAALGSGQVVFRYLDGSGQPTEQFPANPNGSPGGVAGVCDPTGRILGLMPHPERNVDPLHHPRWTRRPASTEGDGLRIFRNAVNALRS